MACVIDYSDPRKPLLKCTCCGGTDPLSLPVTVSQLTALVNLFQDKHAMCPVREELKNAPKWSDLTRACPNCKGEGPHFVPPSLGEPGFFTCDVPPPCDKDRLEIIKRRISLRGLFFTCKEAP